MEGKQLEQDPEAEEFAISTDKSKRKSKPLKKRRKGKTKALSLLPKLAIMKTKVVVQLEGKLK